MLNQYIEIQSSNSKPDSAVGLYALQLRPPSQTMSLTPSIPENCPRKNFQAEENKNCNCSISTKSKLKKLQELYEQGVQKLQTLKIQNSYSEKQKTQTKIFLQQQIREFSHSSYLRSRKGSQTSTAGEDDDGKCKADQICQRNEATQNQVITALETKLEALRKTNNEASKIEQQKIARLKSLISSKQSEIKLIVDLNSNNEESQAERDSQIQSNLQLQRQLQQKMHCLSSAKSNLIDSRVIISEKIKQTQKSVISMANNAEYLKSTQICCQQILNEEIYSLRHKIEGRKVEYESNKRYLDKIIRTRKYEEKVSFEDIERAIKYLNQECEQMMNKKNGYFGPEIKKYKQKRLEILEQIKTIKKKIVDIQDQKKRFDITIIRQNKTYDQLQDEYCALLEKADQKFKENGGQLAREQKVRLLKEKKQNLSSQVKKLVSQYQQVKLQIDTNQSLVPQSLIKDFSKKIRNKKQQMNQFEALLKENRNLEIQNASLNEQKQKMEWKTNPQLQKLLSFEKQMISEQASLREQLKVLKEQNQNLEEKLLTFKENEQSKRSEAEQQNLERQKREKEEQQKAKKLQDQRKFEDREKLMQKFRQKKQNQKNQFQSACFKESSKQKISQQVKRGSKTKKGKSNQKIENVKADREMDSSRLRGFFGRRENPLETLRSDFPLNRSQDTSVNVSLLSSDPALYMFFIFVTVVIPGLCIGYNF